MVEPGRRCLADRYELGELIASGGMGQVWRGTDVLLGRPVAVKVLRSEYTGDSTFLARFRAEAQHAAALSHPNIARVFDYGEVVPEDGSGETLAFLVMELVDGRPLSAVLAEGPLELSTSVSILRQTGLALAEAHRVGMVHRDVKPGNILVRADGSVKITDFGIAWSAGSVPLTRTGQVIGTPQYLSPEQAQGRTASPASDVYALGLVGYECLTGHSAFDGDNAVTIALKQLREQPEPLPGELPGTIRALIDRALVKDPDGRLPDGSAFVSALEAAVVGRVLPEPPPTVPPVDPAPGWPLAEPHPSGAVRVPPPRRTWGRRAAFVVVPLVALLAGAGITAVVLQGVLGGGRPGGSSAAVAADTGERTGYRLVAADYVGRPVDEVAVQLSALGLDVRRAQQVTDAAAPDTVTGVDPAGVLLRPGDPVTVSYAAPPPVPGSLATGVRGDLVTQGSAASPTTARTRDRVVATDPSTGGSTAGSRTSTTTDPATSSTTSGKSTSPTSMPTSMPTSTTTSTTTPPTISTTPSSTDPSSTSSSTATSTTTTPASPTTPSGDSGH